MQHLRPQFVDQINEQDNVAIAGFEWTPYDILEGMLEEEAAAEVFNKWFVRYKAERVERCQEFLEETECLDRFKELAHRVNRESVLPLIGAGMSIPCGFKSWGPFLLSLLADAPDRRPEVETLLEQGKYEEAASFIENLSCDCDLYYCCKKLTFL